MIVLPLSEFGIYSRECPSFRSGDVDGSAEEVGRFVVGSVVATRQLGLVEAAGADGTFVTGKSSSFAAVEVVADVGVVVVVAAGNFAWVLFVGRLAVNSSFAVVVVDG